MNLVKERTFKSFSCLYKTNCNFKYFFVGSKNKMFGGISSGCSTEKYFKQELNLYASLRKSALVSKQCVHYWKQVLFNFNTASTYVVNSILKLMAKFIFILVSRAYVRLVNSLPPKNYIPQKHYFLWLKLKAVNCFCETLYLRSLEGFRICSWQSWLLLKYASRYKCFLIFWILFSRTHLQLFSG